MKIGERIKQLRKSKGYKQYQFAKKLGMHPYNLGRIEGGFVDPRYSTLERIAKALDMDTFTLLGIKETDEEVKSDFYKFMYVD